MKDVFICHAGEDKATVVRPLSTDLQQAGITLWLDEEEIRWGSSVTEQVNRGMDESRYAIIVFSEAFFSKNWPKRELLAFLNIESSDGQVKVLPLIVGGPSMVEKVRREYPLQNDKRYLEWNGNTGVIIRELRKLLKPELSEPPFQQPRYTIPIPKIKKTFSDRDRNKFLDETFKLLRNYFGEGLKHLEQADARIQTDLKDVNNLRFSAWIYLDGNVRNQCLIWIGGSFGSSQISYREGHHLDLQHEASYNDWLHVESGGDGLFLKSMGLYGQAERFTPEKGAEYLWNRFTNVLQYT